MEINITKGFKRIFFIIALISIPLCFGAGYSMVNEDFKTLTPQYKAWKKEYSARKNHLYEIQKKEREEPLQKAIQEIRQRKDLSETRKAEEIRKIKDFDYHQVFFASI